MPTSALTRALAIGLLMGGSAHATTVIYDDFSSLSLDPTRWAEGEMWRYVDPSGRVALGRNTVGGQSADSGVVYENMNLSSMDATPAKVLRATIKVLRLAVPSGCPSNTTQTFAYSRARVIGALFNARAGGPVAGERTGDVMMQIRVGRSSSSADAAGVLRVQGLLSMCTNVDCNQAVALAPNQDLGTVLVGGQIKVTATWNQAGKSVTYIRDALPPLTVGYTLPDTVAPAVPFNNVSVRNEVPNCMGAPVRAGISALFDNVVVAY